MLALVAVLLLSAASCSLIDANVRCRMAGQRLDYNLGGGKLAECTDPDGQVQACCNYRKKTTLSPSLAGCSVAGVEIQLADADTELFMEGLVHGLRESTVRTHGSADSWNRLLESDGTAGLGAPHSALGCSVNGCGRATWRFEILRAAATPDIEEQSSCPEDPSLLLYVGH